MPNKEQKKFEKVMQSRKRRKRYLRAKRMGEFRMKPTIKKVEVDMTPPEPKKEVLTPHSKSLWKRIIDRIWGK